MLGFGTIGQFSIGQVAASAGSEFIGPDKWMVAFTDPVRFKPGLYSARQVAFTYHPTPVVSFSWYGALAEPVRKRPVTPAALTLFYSMQPAPSPFVANGWYNWLSEPVRLKPGLRAQLHKVDTQDTVFTPSVRDLTKFWFQPLSEPKRFPKGISAQFQHSYTAHPRVLPKPNVTAILAAVETNNDQALMAINVVRSNPPATADVSIIEIGNGLSPTAVIEH